jgi:hypothetical protein
LEDGEDTSHEWKAWETVTNVFRKTMGMEFIKRANWTFSGLQRMIAWTLWRGQPSTKGEGETGGYHEGDRVWLYRPTRTKGKSPKLQIMGRSIQNNHPN